jgi:GntR family transcriptional regulator, transcriptional repressor for pyruvate dehydrogenase complex
MAPSESAPLFKKEKPFSLVDNLVKQLEETILAGKFKPGEKLPPSGELETAMGASRGTLHEALRILQQKGLVESRVGVKGGVFIREANTDPVTEGLAQLIRRKKISLDDLSGFRQVIESGLIQLVSERIVKRDIDILRKHLTPMQEATSRGAAGWHAFLDVEVRLRKELIRISGSHLYEAVLTPIFENIFSYATSYISGKDADVAEALDDWTQIVDALASGDRERAIFYTCDHIRRYAQRMKKGMAKSQNR